MEAEEMKERTKAFALRITKLIESLPGYKVDVIGKRLQWSAASIEANYRAACRAKSFTDFISKMDTAEEKTYESIHWMELLIKHGILDIERLEPLLKEANELLTIIISSIKITRNYNKLLNSYCRVCNEK